MKWILLLCLVVALFADSQQFFPRIQKSKDEIQKDAADLLMKELEKHRQTGIETPILRTLLKVFEVPQQLLKLEGPELPVPRDDAMCALCNSVFGAFIDRRRIDGQSRDEIAEFAKEFCKALTIFPPRVCDGAVDLNADIMVHIMDNRPEFDENHVCAYVFQNLGCPADMSAFEWSINVAGNKPPLTGDKDNTVPQGPNDIKIVHISDPHYDPNYQEGTHAVCGEPSCCRSDQPLPPGTPASEAAGYWGDYRDCDSPFRAVQDSFRHIRSQHPNIDYVYFTGDIVDHGIWATSFDWNRNSISRVHTALRESFGGIPTYPVIGNHEAHPTNVFAPDSLRGNAMFSTQWLYDFLANEWSAWLPAAALTTVRNGGYYTVLVRPGFRIIALNNNQAYTWNFWGLYDPQYARNQLQWFHDTLLAAESAGEKVHVIGHVPSGSGDTYYVYAREYAKVVERFWNTISGQFMGHTHADQFTVFYAQSNPQQAVNVQWNGGSTTAFTDVNPNYKVYTADPQTYQINGHETWIYNLTQANLTPQLYPSWFKEYDFMTEYGISNMSPATLNALAESFARNPQRLHRYWQLTTSLADTSLANGCDNNCLASHLCQIVRNVFGNSPRCDQLQSIFWSTVGGSA
ncbi:sphingomyelin phosphodiesterase-like [Phlebotomus argentipes]|uniref:sphingomyelin phosphodiesterase-like n=1 Tax=Phlebotomus argentipes TaxID=94469 RepID=UPI002893134B|nr:sphingomyelin phosphodiesterase-like [Phlebotomus argentipes]